MILSDYATKNVIFHSRLVILFSTFILGVASKYADVVWNGCSDSDSNLLETLKIEGVRVVTGALRGTSS